MVGQFNLYKRFDVTHTSTPQNVYRFESVKYSHNNLYWNEDTKVYLVCRLNYSDWVAIATPLIYYFCRVTIIPKQIMILQT